VQEQIDQESVEPVDAARVSSWLAATGEAVTEATVMGQHAARASPSDAAFSMQQPPQSLRERELEAEVQKLKAQLEATATFAQHPDLALSHQIYAEFLEIDGFLKGLRAMDDKALREAFKQFADIQNKGSMSKQGLAKMCELKNVTLSQGKLEELISRIDTDGNGEIDWLEFRALARSSSELEMMFKALPLERVLAACFARGSADDPLKPFFSQEHSDVVAGVRKAGHIHVEMIVALIKKQNEARAKEQLGAGGAKYGGEFKGETAEKFFEGITGICGEPHPGV
jgi:Ca2+-binding EF-hand superfamily protein